MNQSPVSVHKGQSVTLHRHASPRRQRLKFVRGASFLLVLLALVTASAPVSADGRFFGTESIPPQIPYQRALLFFDGERETLVVQSTYSTSMSKLAAFGWIVPVPDVPDLATMDRRVADVWFGAVDRASSPEVVASPTCFSPGS